MLNTYDNFTLNSIFRPKAFGRNIELRVKLSCDKQFNLFSQLCNFYMYTSKTVKEYLN